jgi:hypothetical protein
MNGGKLYWPILLRQDAFTGNRQQIDQAVASAVRQAAGGSVNADVLDSLNQLVANMKAQLRGMIDNVSANQYIEANSFLNELSSGILALSGPNVANFFNGTWTVQASDVVQLVTQMTNKGLKFAPATWGDDWAYQRMYQALLAYDNLAAAQVASSK